MVVDTKFSYAMKPEDIIIFNSTEYNYFGSTFRYFRKLLWRNNLISRNRIGELGIWANNSTTRFLTFWNMGELGRDRVPNFNITMNGKIQCGTRAGINEQQGSYCFLPDLNVAIFCFFKSNPCAGLDNHLIGNNEEREQCNYRNSKLNVETWLILNKYRLAMWTARVFIFAGIFLFLVFHGRFLAMYLSNNSFKKSKWAAIVALDAVAVIMIGYGIGVHVHAIPFFIR
ncbi:MAG TPA: hypothetical protein DCP24_13130 [Nitrospiraceae bacterium]|nr:MAG: hypothetical protein A2Z82_05045 [Nitrospirae bacterium GWA2_46_11]HAK89976.1 hypothetical protein [Nitrospiraceae bacterium]